MNLPAIADIYVKKMRPRAQKELDWFSGQPSLESAIEHAALAVNSKGKMYSHQWRISKTAMDRARQLLHANSAEISQSRTFDELFALLEAMLKPIDGIGELYIYDTALRIGAYLNLFPTKVYLHRGVREGAERLGLDTTAKTLELEVIPPAFTDSLEPHEIEDVLCIFKDEFKAEDVEEQLKDNSWCT